MDNNRGIRAAARFVNRSPAPNLASSVHQRINPCFSIQPCTSPATWSEL